MRTIITAICSLMMFVGSANAYIIGNDSVTTNPFGQTWNGSSYIWAFGENNTATYGQTITTFNIDNIVMKSFTVYIDDLTNPGAVDFKAYVASWDGDMIDNILWQSKIYTTTNNNGAGGFEEFTFNTNNLSLDKVTHYALFVSASGLFDGVEGMSKMGGFSNTNYDLGNFVYSNNGNDFNSLYTTNWDQFSTYDLAFRADFVNPGENSPAATPEPGTMLLMGIGAAGTAYIKRRKSNAKS